MDMTQELGSPEIIEFGRFAVVPYRREVLFERRPIKLGGRAFDMLMALVEARGNVVSRDALMRRVWPGAVVEENSLQRQIATLRKAFAEDRDIIRTIAGKGYQFTGTVQLRYQGPDGEMVPTDTRSDTGSSYACTNLRHRVSAMIGREAEQSDLVELLQSSRLVTLVGAGGVGKTRLSLSIANHVLPDFADGVWVVELASLSDPEMLAGAVALTLDLKFATGMVSAERVARAVASRHLLIVLDNCEHLAGAAAEMAETLLSCSSSIRVMATSREPLRADGEFVYRVRPLAVPDADVTDVPDLLGHAAVQLFMARARALDPGFAPDAGVIATMAAVCRRLDGIPLAIELAAARAAGLGMEQLAVRLDDRFRLLVDGRRKALPRHRTLRATLDWSYDLLSDPERAVLRRLAVFVGGFTLEAAGAVAATDGIGEPVVVGAVVDLVAKSLVVMDTDAAKVRYRLLETTRAYALEKLAATGECEEALRRHAEHYCDYCTAELGHWRTWPRYALSEGCRREIDNIRAALDWAFSLHGDAAIGVDLAMTSVPLWLHLWLVDECRRYVQKALSSPPARSNRQLELRLLAALAASQMGVERPTPEATKTLARALDIADSLDDGQDRAQVIAGLWVYHAMRGDYRVALSLARKIGSVPARDGGGMAAPLGDWLTGTTLHYQGEQAAARRLLEATAETNPSIGAVLARVLWLQGCPEQAISLVARVLKRAAAAEPTAWTMSTVLSEAACPIALMTGDLDAFEHYVQQLLDLSERHCFDCWRLTARCFEAVLRMRRVDLVDGLEALRVGLDELNSAAFRQGIFAIELARGLGMADRIDQAFQAIDSALDLIEHNDGRWCLPELLRVRGRLLLRDGPSRDVGAAETQLRQSLDVARQQGAVFWEQRTAASLAQLLQQQSRTVEAGALLAAVSDRRDEDPDDDADVQAAGRCLDKSLERTVLTPERAQLVSRL
jgi:predicted ATPase/DNA-binding winged helix-turn-helix (wHTH) protein